MKGSKLFKSLLTTFVVIVLSSPAVVLAGTPGYIEDAKATVSYADLNLESEEGVRVLYRRLQRASNEACHVTSPKIAESNHMKSWRRQATQRCYRKTLSQLVEKVENEDLTRIHAG